MVETEKEEAQAVNEEKKLGVAEKVDEDEEEEGEEETEEETGKLYTRMYV